MSMKRMTKLMRIELYRAQRNTMTAAFRIAMTTPHGTWIERLERANHEDHHNYIYAKGQLDAIATQLTEAGYGSVVFDGTFKPLNKSHLD